MNPVQQTLLGWEALRRSARHLRAGSLWVPWVVLGAVQLLVLACLAGFAHPAISWFMAPLLRRLAGEDALRYPNVFQLMPALYGRASVLVDAVPGAVMAGAALWLYARRFEGHPARAGAGLAVAVRRGLALVLVNLPGAVLIHAVLIGGQWWNANHGGPRLMRFGVHYGTLGLALAVQAFFAYAAAYVVIEGRSALQAWARLGEAARRGFWAALFVSAVLFLPHLPLNLLGRAVPAVVQRGRPELVTGLVGTEILVGLVTSLLLAGCVSLVFLSAVAETAEEGA